VRPDARLSHVKATDEQIAALEERFAERMGGTGIRLPSGAAQRREPGHIFERGWHISYLWGQEDGEEYLELLVQGFAIDDAHVRWWASGREERLPAPDEWIAIPPSASSAEISDATAAVGAGNKTIYDELRERGLLPPEGKNLPLIEANEFLGSGGDVQPNGEEGDARMTDADSPMGKWIGQAAATLEAAVVPPLELREKDLADAIKEAINAEVAGQAIAKVLSLDAWPLLGRSGTDVVILDAETSTPSVVAELKWCQQGQDKVHEAIWDLFKVALLVYEYSADGYLVTAAPAAMWQTALGGELLSTGTFASTALFELHFPDGRPIWDWMLQGGYTNRYRYPHEVPDEIAVTEVARVPVTLGKLSWEIRAVRVSPGAGRLTIENGWPTGERPPNATHPTAAG
jgi:hypothetical protein